MEVSKFYLMFALILHVVIVDALKVFKDLAVSKAFENAKIVPDIISVPPASKLKITWGAASAELGNTICPALTVLIPKIEFETTPGKYYTRVFFDPDAPSPAAAVYGSYLLLLYVNSPASNLSTGFLVAPRIPPTPAPDSGRHRYISLVYEQRDYIDPYNETLIDYGIVRTGFNVRKMAADYGFGDPVAGNLYYGEILKKYDKNTCGSCLCNNKM